MKKKTSLKDIASKVGVSIALVSYVLNNKKEGRIRKEVAAKIRAVAAKLNYRPNHSAKSLKTSKTNTIGLIVADISNPFSSGLARIIEDEADRHGYTVIFGSSDEKAERSARLIDTLLNRQVDGLIIFPPAESGEQIEQLGKQEIPFVLVDRYFTHIDANQVALNNYEASYNAVQHLIENGRTRIGMITYKTPLLHLQERSRGYRMALKHSKIRQDKNWLKQVKISNDPGEIEVAVAALINVDLNVDALFFASNRIAAIALKYLSLLPIEIPRQLAIFAFDETEIFDFYNPQISYVKQPLNEMGRTATRILLEHIGNKKPKEKVLLSAELVIRGSSI